MHRSEFNSQSMQSSDQATLFSARYTSDPDAKLYRGFTPGKLSDELRAALGCKKNQLPPFIYMMRKYGYPAAWLIEAKVDSSNKLSVHNGDKIDGSVEESVIPGGKYNCREPVESIQFYTVYVLYIFVNASVSFGSII